MDPDTIGTPQPWTDYLTLERIACTSWRHFYISLQYINSHMTYQAWHWSHHREIQHIWFHRQIQGEFSQCIPAHQILQDMLEPRKICPEEILNGVRNYSLLRSILDFKNILLDQNYNSIKIKRTDLCTFWSRPKDQTFSIQIGNQPVLYDGSQC